MRVALRSTSSLIRRLALAGIAVHALVAAAGGQQQPEASPTPAADPHAHHHMESPPGQGGDQSAALAMDAPKPRVRSPEQAQLESDFILDYIHRTAPPRELFERYLPKLGAAPMLDFLEERDKLCHDAAHELGQSVFAYYRDVGRAVSECGSRCSFGCLHGALKEAFGERKLVEIEPELPTLCQAIGKVSRPGSCAHGIGHALMLASGNDVDKSIAACAKFGDRAMEYYCSSGVYMELFDQGGGASPADTIHPCDQHPYPTACFFYLTPRLYSRFGDRLAAWQGFCRSLPGAQRLGCFEAAGLASFSVISKRPEWFASACPSEPLDEATMCIETVIEKLGVYDPTLANRACDSLQGKPAEICRAAAREGTYRLDKPSLPLYLGQ